MMRSLKTSLLLGSLCLAGHSAWSFALFGPFNEPYQVVEIGYNQRFDLGAPKNLAEEYRRNTPVLYYAFDANFLDYFGSNGVASIESAFAVVNSVTNASQLSQDLNDWPLATLRENQTATALSLLDLKSYTLAALMEQLGLAEPERYIWNLHTRLVGPGGCPADMYYSVMQRNFDPVVSALNQFQSTPYVNGVLYTYYISEICAGPPPTLAEALELKVDPADQGFTAVAGGSDNNGSSEGYLGGYGRYFIGLTRDDVAGLRYLLRTNNLNVETAGPGTLTYVTNNTPQLLVTSNLLFVAEAALTNAAGAVQGLFPGLTILSSSNYFVNVWVTNVTPYFTNSPYDPVGTPARLEYATNLTLTVQTRYQHVFANLYTPQFTNNQWIAVLVPDVTVYTNLQTMNVQTVAITNSPYGGPYDPPVTNISNFFFQTNYYGGEYFILPTNSCEVSILALQATFTNIWTNFLVASTNLSTNAPPSTNGVANTNVQFYTQSLLTYSTNHAFVILPITCETNTAALRQGIDKITFVRRHYDSLLGTFFEPTTNFYVLNSVTNSRIVPQRIQRPVNVPDLLISARDDASGPGADPEALPFFRTISFSTNALGAYPGLAGPGTIETPTIFYYNKVGPIWYQDSGSGAFDFFPDPGAEAGQIPLLIWGSFDGSTNDPVVYPNGTSIENLENLVLVNFTPPVLAPATAGQAYSVNFTATGVIAPLTWSLTPGSPALPPGLTLTPAGLLSGTPVQDDTFDFGIRVTDSTGRSVDRAYSLTVNPL